MSPEVVNIAVLAKVPEAGVARTRLMFVHLFSVWGEYAISKTHPDIGMRMLAGHPFSALVQDCVLLHHERPDGRGYPHGLKTPDIPTAARIVGICDAFDAMTSARPYRTAMSIDQALAIVRQRLDRQFDGHLGEHFLTLGAEHLLDHIQGHSDDGIPLRECLMCGPTLVLRRMSRPGDLLYCGNCRGEYRLETDDSTRLRAVPTGALGSPADLEPSPDNELIARLVRDTARRSVTLSA